jgi:uncharacterized protein
MHFLIYTGIGLLAGIAGGIFGIGGAIIIIPLLIFFQQFPQHLAQGTTLGALLLPIGFLAAWRYWQDGNVHVMAACGIALGFFFGGWIGAHFAQAISGPNLRRAFGVFIIVVGAKMIMGK